MAKKKVAEKVAEDLSSLFYNDKKVMGDFSEDGDTKVLSTGIIPLDIILGGGIPVGNYVSFVGDPGSGKSTLGIQIVAQFVKKYGPTNCAYFYLDSEQCLTRERMEQLGVENPNSPITGFTLERGFSLIKGICEKKEKENLIDFPTLIVIDSLSGTPTERHEKADGPTGVVGYAANYLSFALPRYQQLLKKFNITLVMVTQFRAKIDMNIYQQSKPSLRNLENGKKLPGGEAFAFHIHTLLQTFDIGMSKKEDDYPFVGTKVFVNAVKNKLFTPKTSACLLLDYNRGISSLWSSYVFLKDREVIKSSGSVWKLGNTGTSFVRKDFLAEMCNPEFHKLFVNLIYEEALKFISERVDIKYYPAALQNIDDYVKEELEKKSLIEEAKYYMNSPRNEFYNKIEVE